MKRVLLLLANGFEAFEAAAFSDVLGWANVFGSEPIEVITAGLHEKLKCTFALEVVPELQLAEVKVEEFDALAIPGGFEKAGFYEDAYSPEFLNIIRQFTELDKLVASVCVGALALGKSGILKDRCATTYHLLEGRRRKELAAMGAEVIDAQLVQDGGIITSTSPATATDVAFALLEKLTSSDNAKAIRRWMGF
ncbi:MAG TPA: DJ-1/PfpI family protein [Dehalococcoidia bacterium]|nr:DJ-1/PfpI family protein [Dehalococcoidia bacterium]